MILPKFNKNLSVYYNLYLHLDADLEELRDCLPSLFDPSDFPLSESWSPGSFISSVSTQARQRKGHSCKIKVICRYFSSNKFHKHQIPCVLRTMFAQYLRRLHQQEGAPPTETCITADYSQLGPSLGKLSVAPSGFPEVHSEMSCQSIFSQNIPSLKVKVCHHFVGSLLHVLFPSFNPPGVTN